MTLALQITPVPKPLFGINLRSKLRRSEWAAIKRSLIESRGCKCGTCGKAIRKPSDLQAHEEWAYDTTVNPAVATIKQVVVQCRMCHGCEHFFRMLVLAKNGVVVEWQINDLIEHFCSVNGVDRQEFDTHAMNAWNEWKRLSALRWRVDLRPYSQQLIPADPDPHIKALSLSSERPWDDPGDGKRRSEFLYLLAKLSTTYGYWIGRTSKSEAVPLHVLEPGTRAGEYCMSRIVIPDTEGTPSAPHTLQWSDDPMARPIRSKRRRSQK